MGATGTHFHLDGERLLSIGNIVGRRKCISRPPHLDPRHCVYFWTFFYRPPSNANAPEDFAVAQDQRLSEMPANKLRGI